MPGAGSELCARKCNRSAIRLRSIVGRNVQTSQVNREADAGIVIANHVIAQPAAHRRARRNCIGRACDSCRHWRARAH